MKRFLTHKLMPVGIVFLILLLTPHGVKAQTSCSLSISGDSEPRCLVTMDKPAPFDDTDGDLVACQGAAVTYTATVNTGNDPVSSWAWTVAGASAWTDLGQGQISVVWGTGSSGQIRLAVTTAGGTTCSVTYNVSLIGKPTAAAATVPAYHVEANGDKVIYVCKGDDVEFVDMSVPGDKDITGYCWRSQYSSATTRNFTLHNVTADDEVVLRVYNECGCYDEETFIIETRKGYVLNLNCYGTACQNDVVTYVATSPVCDKYYWSVDGGTVLDGQGNDSLTVQWDRPHDGYGTISLDGVLCGYDACPSILSKKVPVIHDNVRVDGKTEVCVGEGVVYSVPLFGSTLYTWSVTPSTGVTVSHVNGANKIHAEFTSPGVYTVKAVYRCDFLDCGTYTSEVLSVTVKPPLTVMGRNRICSGNSCSLTTDAGVAATWTVYDLATGQQAGPSSAAMVNFVRAFPTTGRYRVVAEHSSYCNLGEFFLSVLDPPPAPVVGDLDPSNPTIACPESSIRLGGTPSSLGYSLVWKPECNSATPGTVSGDNVTVTYSGEVCSVRVHNYDRKLECLSTGYYVHPVSEFTLLPIAMSSSISVCPGTDFSIGGSLVPYQAGVLYRWSIEDDKQYCASIVGSAMNNTVHIQVNEIAAPDNFHLYLSRRYCSGEEDIFDISISVGESVSMQLTIDATGPVCVGDEVTLTGTGCGDIGIYQWEVDGVRLNGNTYTAVSPGSKRVKMICNTFSYCDNEEYYSYVTGSFTVNMLPTVRTLEYHAGGTVGYRPMNSSGNYSYIWCFDGDTISNASSAPYVSDGIYTLVITDNNTGCSNTYSQYLDNFHYQNTTCNGLDVAVHNYNYCARLFECRIADAHYLPVGWTVDGGSFSDPQSSWTYNEMFEVYLNSLGTYTITAQINSDPCYIEEITHVVDFIPDFTYEALCNAIVIHNNSQFLDGSRTVTFKCDNTEYTFPLSDRTDTIHNLNIGIHTMKLFKYDGSNINGNDGCLTESVFLGPSTHTLHITTANTVDSSHTCDNTPILLTATASPGNYTIHSTQWNFGDGSSLNKYGNSVYHTFAYNYNPLQMTNIPYKVTATIKDYNGCDIKDSIMITSYEDVLSYSQTNKIFINSVHPICPNGNAVELIFNGSPVSPAIFQWSYPIGSNASYNTYQTGDYHLYLEDAHYCRVEDQENVRFLNAPQADIVTERTDFCLGETVVLYGAPDPDTTMYTFLWTITTPSSTTITRNTATAFFTADQLGAYSIRLDISIGSSCSDYDMRTIYVGSVPPAPIVAFSGNRCIDAPPVNLSGSAAATNAMLWSNGAHGQYANYYVPGYATAYYYDPSTGCRSATGSILIEDQPDFDGLLTGCYERCSSYMTKLPAVGLSTEAQLLSWEWYCNSSIVLQAANLPYLSPLLLPLPYFGSYSLSVDYQGNACNVVSPTLDIDVVDYCLCDSVDISTNCTVMVKDCRPVLTVYVTVTNNSLTPRALSSVSALFDNTVGSITGSTFTPTVLFPGNIYSFQLTVQVSRFLPTGLKFRIDNTSNLCVFDFTVDLMEFVGCMGDMSILYDVNPDLSNGAAAYLDFAADISPAQTLLAFWSEPPMVIDYLFDNVNTVYGLEMVDLAVLSQLVAENGKICFYAVVCNKDELCLYECCVDASKIYNKIVAMGEKASDGNEIIFTDDSSPRLMPNPTNGHVIVSNHNGVVTEIVIMDMNGRNIASFFETKTFDISDFPSGMYIVRVKTNNNGSGEKINYLKLVKK